MGLGGELDLIDLLLGLCLEKVTLGVGGAAEEDRYLCNRACI